MAASCRIWCLAANQFEFAQCQDWDWMCTNAVIKTFIMWPVVQGNLAAVVIISIVKANFALLSHHIERCDTPFITKVI